MVDNDVDDTMDVGETVTTPTVVKRRPWRIVYEEQCTQREKDLTNLLGKDPYIPVEYQPDPDNPTNLPEYIKVTTSEGTVHMLHRNIYAMSTTLYNLVSTILIMGDFDDIIPLDNINSKGLENLIKFIEAYWPMPRGRAYACVCNVDEEVEIPSADTPGIEELNSLGLEGSMQLIMDANFLDIKTVYDKAAQHIASIIQYKEPAEVCNLFGIKEDM